MKEIHIEVVDIENGDIEAFVLDDGKKVDSHIHGGEGHILNDWGFKGHDAFKHKEKLAAHFGHGHTLVYKDHRTTI